MGAVLAAQTVLPLPAVEAWLVGDIGRGEGSRRLYAHMEQALDRSAWTVLVFHYLQPDVDWHNRVLFTVERILPRPVLIADAGFMYAAKMSGQADQYDLFTPDVGELAFLADEHAPTPSTPAGSSSTRRTRSPSLSRGPTKMPTRPGGCWSRAARTTWPMPKASARPWMHRPARPWKPWAAPATP
ncbi:hypothetical protein [Desulfosarcina cetonica]|uniref:hypothetical protein n=1 Tax=Desulfosarcina cetonica TaxID=90730 RepID=UPI000AFB07ED|nr:hypothetical protein [Desulfosarcina cetonica]